MIDEAHIAKILRAAIDDAYRLGAAIEVVQSYRGQTCDVETLDRAIDHLRRQSAGAEKT